MVYGAAHNGSVGDSCESADVSCDYSDGLTIGLVLGLPLNHVVSHVLPFRSSDLEQDPLHASQILFSFPAPQIAVLFSLQLAPFSDVLYM